MTGRVEGKVALVTGAASGIGRSVALTLAREGAAVVASDRQVELGQTLVAEIKQAGGTARFAAHDVTDEASWETVIADIRSAFGRLDVLVNNAGIGLSGPVTKMSLEDWRRQTAVNLDGVFLGVKHGLPLMREGGGGSIINMSSVAGIKAAPNASGYSATKGAVRLFTKSIALECAAAKDGVRVNSVHPGIVETAIWDSLIGTSADGSTKRPRSETLTAMASQAVPFGRAGTPQEIADGVLWLASDESGYVTGTELVIAGGPA